MNKYEAYEELKKLLLKLPLKPKQYEEHLKRIAILLQI